MISLLKNANTLLYYAQRFKSKGNCDGHFVTCRAEKPTPEREGESDEESFTQSKERNSSNFTLKKCTVQLHRIGYIDKAAKEGFSTMTYICYVQQLKNGKKKNVGYWQIIA